MTARAHSPIQGDEWEEYSFSRVRLQATTDVITRRANTRLRDRNARLPFSDPIFFFQFRVFTELPNLVCQKTLKNWDDLVFLIYQSFMSRFGVGDLQKAPPASRGLWTRENVGYCTFLLLKNPDQAEKHANQLAYAKEDRHRVERKTKRKLHATKEYINQNRRELWVYLYHRELRCEFKFGPQADHFLTNFMLQISSFRPKSIVTD